MHEQESRRAKGTRLSIIILRGEQIMAVLWLCFFYSAGLLARKDTLPIVQGEVCIYRKHCLLPIPGCTISYISCVIYTAHVV
jgi:hypothetical protein